MIVKKFSLLIPIIILTILNGCNHTPGTESDQTSEVDTLIVVTQHQFDANGMVLGSIEKKLFEERLSANALVIPLSDGYARVSSPIGGIVKNINIKNGQWVKKNTVLFEIGGFEVADLQSTFAATSAQLKRLQNEYNRIETLFQQKAATERERVTAESEYKSLLATYNSLAMKINHFGIDKTPIEDGQFYLTFPIKAPIDGYITEIKSTLGETITSETILTELVNPYSLALKISIFPESISKIAVGQPIRLKTAQNKPKFLGNITAVGLSVDNNSKTVFCSGTIEGIPSESRLMNQYLEVEIITNTDSLPALPKSAIHKNENGTYVFKLNRRDTNSYHFEKFYIKTGREWQDLIEIIDFPPDITILIQGGYNLSSGH